MLSGGIERDKWLTGFPSRSLWNLGGILQEAMDKKIKEK